MTKIVSLKLWNQECCKLNLEVNSSIKFITEMKMLGRDLCDCSDVISLMQQIGAQQSYNAHLSR